jgi:hypothetical protein
MSNTKVKEVERQYLEISANKDVAATTMLIHTREHDCNPSCEQYQTLCENFRAIQIEHAYRFMMYKYAIHTAIASKLEELQKQSDELDQLQKQVDEDLETAIVEYETITDQRSQPYEI